MEKKLDLTKPVQTRAGSPARILATDFLSHGGNLAVAVKLQSGNETFHAYHQDGRYLVGKEDGMDLVNISTKKEGWINLYPSCGSIVDLMEATYHASKERADARADPHRIACIRIEWEE